MAAGHIEMWRRCGGSTPRPRCAARLPLDRNPQLAGGNPASPATPRRHGSVYKTGRRAASAAPDPYDVVREALGKARRQELFSFAAANMLVMGVPERLALLHRCGGAAGQPAPDQLQLPPPRPQALAPHAIPAPSLQPGHRRPPEFHPFRPASIHAGAASQGQPAARLAGAVTGGGGVTPAAFPTPSLAHWTVCCVWCGLRNITR